MIPYKILGGGLAALVLVGGVFYMGNTYGSNKKQIEWDKNEITELNADLAEQKRINDSLLKFSADVDEIKETIADRVVQNTNTITEVRYRNRDVIKEVFRDSPYLTRGWVYSHDQLAKGQDIDPNLASDKTPSNFTEEDSLNVIGDNYANARKNVEKIEGWEDFYAGVRASVERLQDNAERGLPEDSSS